MARKRTPSPGVNASHFVSSPPETTGSSSPAPPPASSTEPTLDDAQPTPDHGPSPNWRTIADQLSQVIGEYELGRVIWDDVLAANAIVRNALTTTPSD